MMDSQKVIRPLPGNIKARRTPFRPSSFFPIRLPLVDRSTRTPSAPLCLAVLRVCYTWHLISEAILSVPLRSRPLTISEHDKYNRHSVAIGTASPASTMATSQVVSDSCKFVYIRVDSLRRSSHKPHTGARRTHRRQRSALRIHRDHKSQPDCWCSQDFTSQEQTPAPAQR